MRKLLMAGAAISAALAMPTVLSAQDVETEAEIDASVEVDLNAEQQAIYDAWPAERRAEYDALMAEQQTYFWTLTPRQQEAYWVLTPEQRTRIAAMTPEARANAWVSIERQLASGANNSETSVAARTGGEVPASRTGADVSAEARSAAAANARAVPPPATTVRTPSEVVRNFPGNRTPPPASALNKTYPVCTARLQDNCQNPGEGGAPGRSRALQHWPGEPASERD